MDFIGVCICVGVVVGPLIYWGLVISWVFDLID
jgi:hypothetical protein